MALSADDTAALRTLHNNLRQEALEPADPFYVDLRKELYGEAFGEDIVAQLARDVSWSEARTVVFFSGFRGAGKSTQLNLLRNALTQDGFAVAKVDVERYLDVRYPITANHLVLAMAAGVWDACVAAGWVDPDGGGRSPLRRLVDWLRAIRPHTGDRVDMRLPDWSPLTFEAYLRRDPTFRNEIDGFLRERSVEFREKAQEFFDQLDDQVQEGFARVRQLAGLSTDWLGLVVIVDSLDHARSETAFHDVRHALREVFDLQLHMVRFDRFRTVFCVPPYLRIDGTVRRIVNIKVEQRDGTPYRPGLAALRDVLARRLPDDLELPQLLDSSLLDQLLRASGGHIRDLLRLLDEVVVRATALPAARHDVERAIVQVRQAFLPITERQRECLAAIARMHELFLADWQDWEGLAELLDRHLVLLYPNQEPWYAVHPLIRGELGPDDNSG